MITRYEDAPERAHLTERELLFLQEPLPFRTPEGMERPIIDFVSGKEGDSRFSDVLSRRVVLSDTDGDVLLQDLGEFEITYNFPETIRNNVVSHNIFGKPLTYGKAGISMRILYEMLCTVFNDGEYFIDRYFDDVFNYSPAYQKLQRLRREILINMARELYTIKQMQAITLGKRASAVRLQDKRGRIASIDKDGIVESDLKAEYERVFDGYGDFSVWGNKIYERELNDIGDEIRDDIVRALSIGEIPLQKQDLAQSTIKRREYAGITTREVFYATGQLIKSINIYINIDREVA